MIESFDDLALRISERCRDIINEELARYFALLMAEVGQRPARVMRQASKPTKERKPNPDNTEHYPCPRCGCATVPNDYEEPDNGKAPSP